MTDAGNVFTARLELHRHDAFRNQLAGHRANNVNAEDFVGRSISQHFYHPRCIPKCPGAAIG